MKPNHQSGATLLHVLVAAVFLGLLVFPLVQMLVRKNRAQNEVRLQENRDGVVEAIVFRALQELKIYYKAGSNSLEPLRTGTLLGAPRYTQASPRIFGKGEFQVDLLQIDPISFAATRFPVRRFYAPETDPRAWIDPPLGNDAYTLHIRTTLCSRMVEGRAPFDDSGATVNPGLGVNWAVPCNFPVLNVEYRGVFLQTNL